MREMRAQYVSQYVFREPGLLRNLTRPVAHASGGLAPCAAPVETADAAGRPALRIRYADAAFGARLRELRWKNSAWLATAETIAGWNGFEIRKAGSGRSPVRKRSG